LASSSLLARDASATSAATVIDCHGSKALAWIRLRVIGAPGRVGCVIQRKAKTKAVR
jgi:hypothetical protein